MELKQLESFVRVAELGSFTRAAAALGMPQPLLSRHVRQLEVELRQTFLWRNGRGVTLTEAGAVLLEHGRGILHQVALAREELGAVRGALAGHVSIGLPPSLSRLVAVPLTRAFRQKLPDAKLTLTEGFSVTLHESLRSGRLDMALLYNPIASPEVELQLLHREALVLISSKASVAQHPAATPKLLKPRMTLADVAKLPLILPSRPNAFRMLIDQELTRLDSTPEVVMEVDGLNAILDLVREGLGFAVLPPYTLSNLVQPHPFSVHSVHSPKLMSELTLVTSARRPSTETHKELAALVSEVIGQSLKAYV
jgi:LysR family nitrogen assimilation transcriptional regulator